MNKKFVYQVGNNKKKLYYDARPTKYQDCHYVCSIKVQCESVGFKLYEGLPKISENLLVIT